MENHAEALAQARQDRQGGNLDSAEQIYRTILETDPGRAEVWCGLGDICLTQGRVAEAVANYQRAVALRPDYAAAHNDLGVAFAKQDKPNQAAANLRQAIQCRPDYAEAHNNLGSVLFNQGKLLQGLRCFQQALQLRPNYAEAHSNLGLARAALGQWPEAIASQQQALAINPDAQAAQQHFQKALAEQQRLHQEVAAFCMAHANPADPALAYDQLGLEFQAQRRWTDSLACFQEAVRLRPEFAEAYNHLGISFKERRNGDEAIVCFREALQRKPDYADAHNHLGVMLDSTGKRDEAIQCYRQALRHLPHYPEAYSNLGCALYQQGLVDQAEACFQKALQLEPAWAPAHNNWGSVLEKEGRLDEALAHYEEAVRLDPDNGEMHFNRGVIWLLRGDFTRGWPEYEWRWRMRSSPARPFKQPRWGGSELGGRTILLYAEQGLGDTIQFARYAPLVRKRGGTVLLQCQTELLSLLAHAPGIDRLVGPQLPLPAFDVHAALLSLPALLRSDLDQIPGDIPYLHADERLVERWRKELAGFEGDFRIGIVWKGSQVHQNDRRRSVRLEQFAPLADLAGVRLFSLQVGPGTEQLADAGPRLGVIDLGSRFNPDSLADAAAVLKCLDLVVTVDTAMAHLAGALAVPAWVALPFVPDWRWLLDREDSPWYPSLRLFRQKEIGNWESVFAHVAEAADQLLKVRRPELAKYGS